MLRVGALQGPQSAHRLLSFISIQVSIFYSTIFYSNSSIYLIFNYLSLKVQVIGTIQCMFYCCVTMVSVLALQIPESA